jgi:hypothetical protein
MTRSSEAWSRGCPRMLRRGRNVARASAGNSFSSAFSTKDRTDRYRNAAVAKREMSTATITTISTTQRAFPLCLVEKRARRGSTKTTCSAQKQGPPDRDKALPRHRGGSEWHDLTPLTASLQEIETAGRLLGELHAATARINDPQLRGYGNIHGLITSKIRKVAAFDTAILDQGGENSAAVCAFSTETWAGATSTSTPATNPGSSTFSTPQSATRYWTSRNSGTANSMTRPHGTPFSAATGNTNQPTQRNPSTSTRYAYGPQPASPRRPTPPRPQLRKPRSPHPHWKTTPAGMPSRADMNCLHQQCVTTPVLVPVVTAAPLMPPYSQDVSDLSA